MDYSVYEIPNSYEFYRLVFAATSLEDNCLSLGENLPLLDPRQTEFIYTVLKDSLNQPKMEAVLKELQALSLKQSSLWEQWDRNLKDAFVRNFD